MHKRYCSSANHKRSTRNHRTIAFLLFFSHNKEEKLEEEKYHTSYGSSVKQTCALSTYYFPRVINKSGTIIFLLFYLTKKRRKLEKDHKQQNINVPSPRNTVPG
jgi:hypothetical protein